MKGTVLALLLGSACLPATASDPGQPLDCSDWVFLEPGLSCSVVRAAPCGPFCGGGSDVSPGNARAVDPLGNLYLTRRILQLDDCGTGGLARRRTEIRRMDSTGTETVIAHIDDRCEDSGQYLEFLGPANPQIAEIDLWTTYSGFVQFDPNHGRLLIALRSECRDADGSCPSPYGGGFWIAGFDGFPTTFEVLQSYAPTSGPLSFRVPYMPEGFQSADYFDSYYGDLATIGDWSQAQPLKCGYPASHPTQGDYLEVADTLPGPEPGQGRYYVTAVTHQGQRRYGRKSAGGALSGRDPTVLPACVDPESNE